MKISDAAALIRTPLIEWARPQSWCDLGCGDGTFTLALAQLLSPGSVIHAVDLDPRALEAIPAQDNGVQIRKVLGDLRSPGLRLPSIDGILMANSLHFIPEQHQLLKRLLSVTDRFLIVEYDRSRPNPWGPYPVDFKRLRELFREVGGRVRGASGDAQIALWGHDVLGLCRKSESRIARPCLEEHWPSQQCDFFG